MSGQSASSLSDLPMVHSQFNSSGFLITALFFITEDTNQLCTRRIILAAVDM